MFSSNIFSSKKNKTKNPSPLFGKQNERRGWNFSFVQTSVLVLVFGSLTPETVLLLFCHHVMALQPSLLIYSNMWFYFFPPRRVIKSAAVPLEIQARASLRLPAALYSFHKTPPEFAGGSSEEVRPRCGHTLRPDLWKVEWYNVINWINEPNKTIKNRCWSSVRTFKLS